MKRKSEHNEWMLHRALADQPEHKRERERILSSLGEHEEIIEVVSAGAGLFRAGVLAITTERVLHVYFRRLWFRGYSIVNVPYSRIERVYAQKGFRGYAAVVLKLVRPRRSLSFSPYGGEMHVKNIAEAIRKEVARNQFRTSRES